MWALRAPRRRKIADADADALLYSLGLVVAIAPMDDVARAQLGELWTAPHAYARLAEILRRMFPCAQHSIVYDWTVGGELGECGHTLEPGGTGWNAFRHVTDSVVAHHQYAVVGSDPFANKAVTTAELFRGREAMLEQVRGAVWGNFGQHFQLRIALYEEGRLSSLAAVLQDERAGDFTPKDAARLDSVARELRDSVVAARALGSVPAGNTVIGQILDAFEVPAFLATQTGAIAHANAAARAAYPSRPGWLSAVLRVPGRHRQTAAVTRVEHEGRSLFLVIPRHAPTLPVDSALPPSLERVAELAVSGLSDKEIANALGLPLATIRTYVSRIYKALGVHNRLGLAAKWAGRRTG